MLAELVFLSRFLGLLYGEHQVALRADSHVKRIELQRDGKSIASMVRPPWQVTVDFGSDLGPYELAAVGFDAAGNEIARDTQLINLARPRAEAVIILARTGGRLTAKLDAAHIEGRKAKFATLKLDGREIASEAGVVVPLQVAADDEMHVVSGEIEFTDGLRVRKELVFGGRFFEQMPAELTAIAVNQRREKAAADARCIVAGGRTTAPVAVEKKQAHVAFVVNGTTPRWILRTRAGMAIADASLHVVSPVLNEGEGAAFFRSGAIRRDMGVREAIRERRFTGTRRYAEAVAAAGMRALRREERRAVVYVLGETLHDDHSGVDPAAVRRYLSQIGVPLHVWSLSGPRPDLAATWGPVEDVSSPELLAHAVTRLGREIEAQRIAWIPGAPLDAYRATASADCPVDPVR